MEDHLAHTPHVRFRLPSAVAPVVLCALVGWCFLEAFTQAVWLPMTGALLGGGLGWMHPRLHRWLNQLGRF